MNAKLVAVLCLFSLGLTGAVQFCHYKTAMENFRMDQFMGTWYWTMQTPNVFSGRGDRCPITVMHERENGTLAYILKYIYTGNNQYTTKEGNMWHCSASKTDGKLMAAMPTQYGYWEARWWILGTDYDNYAASYACWFAPDGSYRAWSMGWCRQKVCPEEHRSALKRIFMEHQIDLNGLEDVEEASCPNP